MSLCSLGSNCRHLNIEDSGTGSPVCIAKSVSGISSFMECDIPRCEKTHFPSKF